MSASEQPASKRLRRIAEHSEASGGRTGGGRDAVGVRGEESISVLPNYFDQLGRDVTSRILSFLGWRDVLKTRVSKTLREASLVTPINDRTIINTENLGRDLGRIGAALPGVQKVWIHDTVNVLPGLNPFDVATPVISEAERVTARPGTLLDLAELSRFQGIKQLVIIQISNSPSLNGSYPGLFALKSLEKLNLLGNRNLRFDLDDISGLPNLKEINCSLCRNLTGDLKSLYHLREKLELLDLVGCQSITGDLMSLAKFSKLHFLGVSRTGVTGDIRDIQPNHFPSLRSLFIGSTQVFGSPNGLMTVDDAHAICAVWRRFLAQSRPLSTIEGNSRKVLRLSPASPDYYIGGADFASHPPFLVELLNVGSRCGYRWHNRYGFATDITWLDPEPRPSDEGYKEYRARLDELEEGHRGSIYRGYSRPPTEEEWWQIRLARE